MCTGELGLSLDMTHTLAASTLACTDAQTEVRFVLTGWWSGAPVRGLHPEGESQVLPGCWGAGQSAVLPGAHIGGKGRHSDSTVWKTFSGNTEVHVIGVGCLCSAPWSQSTYLIWWGLFSLQLYNQLYVHTRTCTHRHQYNQQMSHEAVCRKVSRNALTQARASWKPDIHLVHPCLGPAKIQWSRAETHRKAAQRTIKAGTTAHTHRSLLDELFFHGAQGRRRISAGPPSDDNSLKLRPWTCLMDCFINSAVVGFNCPQLYCSWAAQL